MQTTYCSSIDDSSIAHFFVLRNSVMSFDKDAIFYLLCLSSSVYTIIENMELHNVYMIHITELEERDRSLALIYEFLAPQVYTSLLHSTLLEYILFFNPLVHKLIYISPYCLCLCDPNGITEDADFYCFYNNRKEPSPLCIIVYASEVGKKIINQYKKEYYAWAKKNRPIHENPSEPLTILLQKYSISINSSHCILSESFDHTIVYKDDLLYLDDSPIIFLYTKGIKRISKKIYSSLYSFTFKNQYILMKYAIKAFFISFEKEVYRVSIFSSRKKKKTWKESFYGFCECIKSRNCCGKEYYFFLL